MSNMFHICQANIDYQGIILPVFGEFFALVLNRIEIQYLWYNYKYFQNYQQIYYNKVSIISIPDIYLNE